MMTPPWYERARCRGMDTNLFFPAKGDHGPSRAAKAICAECEVITECLEYGMTLRGEDNQGIFGGTSEMDRSLLKRERARLA